MSTAARTCGKWTAETFNQAYHLAQVTSWLDRGGNIDDPKATRSRQSSRMGQGHASRTLRECYVKRRRDSGNRNLDAGLLRRVFGDSGLIGSLVLLRRASLVILIGFCFSMSPHPRETESAVIRAGGGSRINVRRHI